MLEFKIEWSYRVGEHKKLIKSDLCPAHMCRSEKRIISDCETRYGVAIPRNEATLSSTRLPCSLYVGLYNFLDNPTIVGIFDMYRTNMLLYLTVT